MSPRYGQEIPKPHGVTLPQVPLPGWMAGVRLGGPVSLDGVLAATYDGLRLAVILISPELNYLQYQHSKLKGFASELSRTIPKSPTFPAKLGFIAIPFSQGGTVFTNTLIYHELGHFVFEELNKRRTLNAAITSALTRTLRNAYTSLGYDEKAWCRSQLAIWAEERFCDLFALWVSGPAYSFASMELLSLLGMLGTKGAKDFDSEHPPFAFRFSEHYDQLKKHKWWAAIESMSA